MYKRQELSLIELELVSGASGECLAAAVFLGVSPLGGPWAVAGAAFTAYSACVAGNDYCNDGTNYGRGGKDGGNY
ncbi:hypothetical protein HUN33_22035 [Acinetobacter bereziniae]|uniref:hypothetical protein n=1 Tax=Acinetobacter bereziniae TaxID=106648 RepID=UPI001580504F|nr:hypothetical protein [Acinetobacter bereziniae]NUG82643.1 hypothetical protein [Acinetobacter bereziniae]